MINLEFRIILVAYTLLCLRHSVGPLVGPLVGLLVRLFGCFTVVLFLSFLFCVTARAQLHATTSAKYPALFYLHMSAFLIVCSRRSPYLMEHANVTAVGNDPGQMRHS